MLRALLSCILVTLCLGSAVAAAPLSHLASEFAKLRQSNPDLHPELDGQRLVAASDWESAGDHGEKPWLRYGAAAFYDWMAAARWVQRDAEGLPFGLELYERLEKMVLRHHFYRGFEVRRIKAAMDSNHLNRKAGEALLERIRQGEKINFSRANHSTFAGQFRSDPLDEFSHDGESFRKDGTRYLTTKELLSARRNPLLRVREESLVRLGSGKYRGTIEYPRIKNLRTLVQQSFEKLSRNLEQANDLETKVWYILEFRTELMTIHRSLDGNGRTIRLLADLLFLRLGLPPPLSPIENDIFGNAQEIFEATLEGMQAYVKRAKHRQHMPALPPVLFHWSTEGSFKWMMDHSKAGQAPMQTISDRSTLAIKFPGLIDKVGTHAWSNPIKATNGGPREDGTIEWYLKPNRPPVLVGYFIKPDARVTALRTTEDDRANRRTFDGVDILYHQHFDRTGILIFHDWVILNPEAVSRWTARPEELAPFVEEERQRVRRLGERYPELDNHVIEPETRYIRRKGAELVAIFFAPASGARLCHTVFSR